MTEEYIPHRAAIELGKLHLERADDLGYILNFWNLVGHTHFPEVPLIENLPYWREGLNV